MCFHRSGENQPQTKPVMTPQQPNCVGHICGHKCKEGTLSNKLIVILLILILLQKGNTHVITKKLKGATVLTVKYLEQ